MTVAGQTAVSYTYDNADRLTGLTRGTASVTVAYDNDDRRTSLTLPKGVKQWNPNDVSAELEWDFDDAPAVIPKRLWDSVLDLQDAIIRRANATCLLTQRFVRAVRGGRVFDDAHLAEIDKMVSDHLAELMTTKEEVLRLRSILKWVPPSDIGPIH